MERVTRHNQMASLKIWSVELYKALELADLKAVDDLLRKLVITRDQMKAKRQHHLPRQDDDTSQ